MIASGPTVPDPTTFADALAVLDRFRIAAPEARAHLEAGARDAVPETPKPGGLPYAQTQIVGSGRVLLEAAQDVLARRGLAAQIVSATQDGAVRDLVAWHAAGIRRLPSLTAPLVLLSGAEATVTLRGDGVGGRNHEFALWLLRELGEDRIRGLSAGSDGIDGSSAAAGASPQRLKKGSRLPLRSLNRRFWQVRPPPRTLESWN